MLLSLVAIFFQLIPLIRSDFTTESVTSLIKTSTFFNLNLIEDKPEYLKKFRLTPNIRIKYSQELEDNVGRGLDTALPHSDAWVEGPWGMNCHMPIFGDADNNYLHFYKLKDESKFNDNFLETSAEYTDMQWTVDYYENDTISTVFNSRVIDVINPFLCNSICQISFNTPSGV